MEPKGQSSTVVHTIAEQSPGPLELELPVQHAAHTAAAPIWLGVVVSSSPWTKQAVAPPEHPPTGCGAWSQGKLCPLDGIVQVRPALSFTVFPADPSELQAGITTRNSRAPMKRAISAAFPPEPA